MFWDETLRPGTVLKVRPSPPNPTYATHKVSRGDTLLGLASKYGTSVRAIQAANNMGRKTKIRTSPSGADARQIGERVLCRPCGSRKEAVLRKKVDPADCAF